MWWSGAASLGNAIAYQLFQPLMKCSPLLAVLVCFTVKVQWQDSFCSSAAGSDLVGHCIATKCAYSSLSAIQLIIARRKSEQVSIPVQVAAEVESERAGISTAALFGCDAQTARVFYSGP